MEMRQGKRLLEDGATIQEAAQALNVAEPLIVSMCMPKVEQEPAIDPLSPPPTTVQIDAQSDEHGPMPGSDAWNNLSPQQKGALTKARRTDEGG